MKYILTFFLSLNLYAYTETELSSWTINDKLGKLLQETYPMCEYKFQEDQPEEFEFLINITGTEAGAADTSKLKITLDGLKEYHRVLNCKKRIRNKYKSIAIHKFWLIKQAGLANVRNPKKYLKTELGKKDTLAKCVQFETIWIDKIVEKMPELQIVIDARNTLKNQKETAKEYIKNFDCNTLAGFQKAVCILWK